MPLLNSMEETNAQQALVLFDKKAEVILSDGRFAEVAKIRVAHMIAARSQDDFEQLLKLILQVVKIDNKKINADELGNLYIEDFNAIARAMSK